MNTLIKKLFSLFSLAVITACSQSPAFVENKRSFSKSTPTSIKENPFKVSVKEGDTLYKIAKEYGIEIRDLIEANKLRPPYRLSSSQILKLPRATFHMVKEGDTLYAISRSFGVDISRLAKINDVSHPYTIKAGVKLRIPSKSFESEEVQVASYTPAPVAKEATPHIRNVLEKDLGLLDNTTERPAYVLPKQVEKIDPNAPKPMLKASMYPSPNLKPGTKYEKKYQKAAYNFKDFSTVKSSGFNWPVQGRLISRFGPKKGGLYNDGINISAREGESIKAADNGIVVYSGNELRGYGNLVLVKHSNGYITAYAHAKDLLVRKGDRVKKGQAIASIGSTGHVTSPQLHFSIRKGRKALDPQRYLPS